MKAKAKTVAAYVRVSTLGQNEAGQRAEIERWLTGNGINPRNARWAVDKGRVETASGAKRSSNCKLPSLLGKSGQS